MAMYCEIRQNFLFLPKINAMKLLVILSRVPYPLEKGDKLRAYHQLRILSQKHEIYLIALNAGKLHPQAIQELSLFCKEIIIVKLHWWGQFLQLLRFLFKGLPLQCGYFYSFKAKRVIDKAVERIKPDHIYGQMIRVAEYIKMIPVKKTLDYQDVLSKGMHRRYEAAPFCLKPFFYFEYKRLLQYESYIFPFFDNRTIITGVDRDLIPHQEFEKINVIANGVDFDTFYYQGESKIYDIIFAGNMNYPPNIEAAEYLAKQIFPILKKEIPRLKLVICGASPAKRVKALKSKDITVTGWVDSMAEYYGKSKIFVAPMHLGTGLQNKLLEAMAMKLPCVTSSLAGKPLEGIQNGTDIMICNSTIGYVEAIRLLLTNHSHYEKIAQNGYQFVSENYNWDTIVGKLEEIISKS
jgi:polysaccharide biosynthesis protein PslH